VKSFIRERENIVMDSLINFEPMKRFKNRKNMMKFRNFGDSINNGIKNKLQTLSLSRRKIQ
jgi:hypothetical protein